MRGQLRTKILEHLSLWESAHVNAEYIRELSHPSKLKNKGSLQASRIEALAIAFWSQKAKVPLEECCHDDKMVTQMAKSIYFFQRKINKMDNKMFRKISLHWHDIFPSWIPTIKGFVKLITLASGVAGRAIMNARPIEEAQNEFKALIATIPPASEPTAAMLDGVLKRWQEQRSKSGKQRSFFLSSERLHRAAEKEARISTL